MLLACFYRKVFAYSVSKGTDFSLEIKKEATDVTYEMLQRFVDRAFCLQEIYDPYLLTHSCSGEWKNATFKKYNFDAVGVAPSGGALHPLMKVRQEFREIFFEMGFQEMPTNRFVESSFWNFDALFQPQQHPARDAHDTFFIKGKISFEWWDKSQIYYSIGHLNIMYCRSRHNRQIPSGFDGENQGCS